MDIMVHFLNKILRCLYCFLVHFLEILRCLCGCFFCSSLWTMGFGCVSVILFGVCVCCFVFGCVWLVPKWTLDVFVLVGLVSS